MQYGTLSAVVTDDGTIHAAGFMVYAPGQFPSTLQAFCGAVGEAAMYCDDEYDTAADDFCSACVAGVNKAAEARAAILAALGTESMADAIHGLLKGDR